MGSTPTINIIIFYNYSHFIKIEESWNFYENFETFKVHDTHEAYVYNKKVKKNL